MVGGVFDLEPDSACAAAENTGDIRGNSSKAVGGECIAYHNEAIAPEVIQHHAWERTAFNCLILGLASQFRMEFAAIDEYPG